MQPGTQLDGALSSMGTRDCSSRRGDKIAVCLPWGRRHPDRLQVHQEAVQRALVLSFNKHISEISPFIALYRTPAQAVSPPTTFPNPRMPQSGPGCSRDTQCPCRAVVTAARAQIRGRSQRSLVFPGHCAGVECPHPFVCTNLL